jgi:hypothetical protein
MTYSILWLSLSFFSFVFGIFSLIIIWGEIDKTLNSLLLITGLLRRGILSHK